jgi:hypothetical protein
MQIGQQPEAIKQPEVASPKQEPTPAVQQSEPQKPEAPKAPAEIVYDLKTPKEMPEGYQIDSKVLEVYRDTVKELKLSNEHAQKVLDKVMPVIARQAEDLQQKQRAEWAELAQRDQEYGGTSFDQNLRAAQTAVKRFGSDKLIEMLDKTGLGNHPEWIRAWYRVGKLMQEDRFVAADKAAPLDLNDDASMAKRLYGNNK